MLKPQVRYLTCADTEHFLEGGGGHLQTRVGPAAYQWGRHKSIKMGRSWRRFLLLVHSEARTRFDDIDKPQPSNTLVTTVVFSIKPRKMMVGPGTVSVRLGRLL